MLKKCIYIALYYKSSSEARRCLVPGTIHEPYLPEYYWPLPGTRFASGLTTTLPHIIIIIIIITTTYGATQPVLSSASQTIHYKHNVGCTNTVVNLEWKISKF